MQARTRLLNLIKSNQFSKFFNNTEFKQFLPISEAFPFKFGHSPSINVKLFSTTKSTKKSESSTNGIENKQKKEISEDNKILKELRRKRMNELKNDLETTNASEQKNVRLQNPFRNLYSFTLCRVLTTCRKYLTSTKEEQKEVTEQSRFFYVKQEIDKLTDEEKEALLKYINEYKYELFKPKQTSENFFEVEEIEITPELIKSRSSKNYTLKRVSSYLKNRQFGGLISRLIIQFLKNDNPDYQLYLNPESDEVIPGKVEPRMKTLGDQSRKMLKNHLTEFAMLYARVLRKL